MNTSTLGAEQLEALIHLSTRLLSQESERDLLETLLHEMSRCLKWDRSEVFLLEEGGNAFRNACSRGWRDEGLGSPVVRTALESLARHCLSTAGPVIVADPSRGEQFEESALLFDQGIAASVCVPVMGSDAIIGALACHRNEPRRFEESEVILLRLIAGQLGLALKPVRDLERSRIRQEELDACLTFLQNVSPRDDSLTSLQKGLVLLTDLVGARYGALAMADEKGVWQTFLHTGFSPEEQGRHDAAKLRPPENEGLLGVLWNEDATLRLDDLTQHPSSIGVPEGHPPMKSFLGVPIMAKGRPLGRVYLTDKQGSPRFSDVDAHLASAFAKVLGLTLENARLFSRLAVSEANLREVLADVKAILWEKDPSTLQCTYISDESSSVLGYPPEQWVGTRQFWINHVHPEDREKAIERWREAVAAGRAFSLEYRMIKADGNIAWVHDLGNAPLKTGGPRRFHGVMIDVTDQRRAKEMQEALEEQLRQSQKMESIGTLAGGIAHDFNNLLQAMMGFADLAKAEVSPGSAPFECLEEVLQAGNRARQLVKQILAFSRQSGKKHGPVRLHRVIEESLKLLRASLPSTIEMRQHIKTDGSTVLADPTEMQQVIINLCTNARDAMREHGGILRIGLDEVQPDSAVIPGLPPGRYLRLMVSDTGEGMDRATVDRIFEPFFTTKEVGKGTGIGLSTVHGIIKGCGGDIAVESQPGKGTTFRLFLPVVSPENSRPSEEEDDERTELEAPKRVLLVDDEEMLLRQGKMGLERLGFRVEARSSSIEALEIFKSDPDGFDALVTDQTMPQLTGIELAGRILQIRPDIPIILCTGFSEVVDEATAKAAGIRDYVRKPVLIRTLAKRLRHVLSEHGESAS